MEQKTFKYGKGGKKPGKYPPEIKVKAVEMYHRARPDFPSNSQCAVHVCELLGIGAKETLITWIKQVDIDSGKAQGMTTDDLEEMRRLRREVAELKRANGILKAASAFFAAELDRPLNK